MSDSSDNTLTTVEQLYKYLDSLFEQDIDSDTLFASGYLRGLIALTATDFGDEQQSLTTELIQAINHKIAAAKAELSPQDSVIVSNFWLELQEKLAINT
ncbi:YfcL family protein [Colwellia demingiae]|uniref:YfcL family protein n=1 Tax=Colwellia demingiae TaxID=89401 RepID=A0A5C6QEE7_9GAMM|nr:YfcL family protein [Colwellia demingiae]TWX67346.1 YfcL family protein [Colwellia demingiae]